ncbi:hypothetical protein ECG_09810 [Echinococcus granulosus]|nr:hypothetical protein ECG_09864 [Echinococcus granulosus]KAH9277943.1 hypothetical protein ECG_09810 [Echinococcus granulosus]
MECLLLCPFLAVPLLLPSYRFQLLLPFPQYHSDNSVIPLFGPPHSAACFPTSSPSSSMLFVIGGIHNEAVGSTIHPLLNGSEVTLEWPLTLTALRLKQRQLLMSLQF